MVYNEENIHCPFIYIYAFFESLIQFPKHLTCTTIYKDMSVCLKRFKKGTEKHMLCESGAQLFSKRWLRIGKFHSVILLTVTG